MEPTEEKLKAQIDQLGKALKTLEEVLALPKSAIIRDSVIKRFEYVYELCWKSMKTACEFKGVESATPRDAIRAAFQAGLIADPQPWFEAIKARNEIVHAYKEDLANHVYETARRLPPLVIDLVTALKKIL